MISAIRGCEWEMVLQRVEAKALEDPLKAKRAPKRKELLFTKNSLLSKVISSFQNRVYPRDFRVYSVRDGRLRRTPRFCVNTIRCGQSQPKIQHMVYFFKNESWRRD
jgi:hypothetical protein